ncbi:MAG: LemA family protein [Candidatus Omnitrophica bacterium]|nr:LemA family protein [Candidatus Omnitrophota bacterium]
MVRITDTIKRIFPNDFQELVPVKKHWWQKIDFNNLKSKQGVILSLSAVIIILPGIWYYNHFIALHRFTEMEQHQIEVQLQRRKDLQVKLIKAVIDYEDHERTVLEYMADRRVGVSPVKRVEPLTAALEKSGVNDISQMNSTKLNATLSKVLALAESYPDLKLSSNFQTLMQAFIQSEDNIAQRRMAYNEAASNFHAYVKKIPACFYAFIFGYRESMFHYVQVDDDVKVSYTIATPGTR